MGATKSIVLPEAQPAYKEYCMTFTMNTSYTRHGRNIKDTQVWSDFICSVMCDASPYSCEKPETLCTMLRVIFPSHKNIFGLVKWTGVECDISCVAENMANIYITYDTYLSGIVPQQLWITGQKETRRDHTMETPMV